MAKTKTIEVGQKWRKQAGCGELGAGDTVEITGVRHVTGFVDFRYVSGPLVGEDPYCRIVESFLRVFTPEPELFTAEASTKVEVPHPSVPPAPHIHDDLTMADRATCGPCNALAEQREHALRTGNPKDAIGSTKAPTMTVPTTIQAEDGLAMLEGALKYGRHNYRVAPVRASVYIDALNRHLKRWIEGEAIDPDSNLSHLTKARACLGIMRDAEICGTLIDDRPPAKVPAGFFAELDAKAAALVAKYPNPVPPYIAKEPVELELDALKARTAPRGR